MIDTSAGIMYRFIAKFFKLEAISAKTKLARTNKARAKASFRIINSAKSINIRLTGLGQMITSKSF